MQHQEWSIIAVRSRLPISVCANVKMMDARTCVPSPVPRNGVKTETFSPQNDHAVELNITFLLTAAVD